MIKLRKMKAEEFPVYCDYFVKDYSYEIVLNYDYSHAEATNLAQQALIENFPDGIGCNENELLCIEQVFENSFKVVGYLWHAIKESDTSTFIYDFYIADEFRSKGYGKKAISQFELLLASLNINQIKLRVAYHNQRALSLYQEVGFAISGYNMSKTLAP